MKSRAPFLLFGSVFMALFPCGTLMAEDKGSVWRVKGPAATVYLAGSVHLLRETDHPLPPVYDKAYADSQRVVFEIDLAAARSPEGQQTSMMLGMLPAGEGLGDWLSPKTEESLQSYMKNRGLSGGPLERLRPGMLAMTITSMEAMRMGALPRFGVEAIFDEKARADGKPVTGLETLEFQLNLFNGMAREEQDRLLRVTLEEVEDTPKVLGAMIAAWRAGDGVKLQEELNRHFEPGDEPLKKRLLTDRNASWIPKIEEAIRAKAGENTLFIVGAGHLVGPDSVIAMLAAKGYEAVQWAPEP